MEEEAGEVRENQAEVKVEINGGKGEEIEDRNNSKELKLEEGLKEKSEDEGNQSRNVLEGHASEESMTAAEEGNRNLEERTKDMTDYSNKPIESNPQDDPHPNTVEEKQEVGQGVRVTPSLPKVLSAVKCFQSQMSSQGFHVQSRTKGLSEWETPRVITQSTENVQSHSSCDSNTQPEANSRSKAHEEGDPPPVKVSELKKRFEA